jgi:cephalosporin hydroxylase
LKTINDLHRSQTGKSSDKWASYLPVYDRILRPYRDASLKLLEVGVQNGGSLEVWSKYFSNAEKLVGCDIDSLCGRLVYDDQRINVVVGDVNTENAFSEILGHSRNFDIIIDDGSHLSDDIIRTFINYFRILSPGGIYVVEDTHTMYQEDYQGGILKQTAAHEFFKLFIDLINYEHWKDDLSINKLFATFFPGGNTPAFLTKGWVEGIEFYNSMVIVRKSRQPSHSGLGERLVVGSEAIVEPATLEL